MIYASSPGGSNELLIDGTCGLGGKCQAGQGWKRFCLHLFHDRRPMVLHGALAEMEVGGDVLVGMAGKDQLHDLALP